jgi:long-subunit acyl-CoA synthetase (AMP-forming)
MAAGVQGQLYSSLAPDAVIAQCWGTTETGWITLFNATEKDTSGSVGHLLPNIRMKVWASTDTPALTRTPGEGLIHSPVMFSGYLGDPKATANAFDPDGFYRTGDLVLVEGDRVFYSGRLKETLKVNGWQVSPTEIEILLLQHPLISDAAVAGITTETEETFPVSGSVPMSFVNAPTMRRFSRPRVTMYADSTSRP